MSVKKEQICRLCLKVAKQEFGIIDELLGQIFNILLLKSNSDISRDCIVCDDCVEVVKKCLYFKATCIDTEQFILSFFTGRTIATCKIEIIYKEREHVLPINDEHLDICRFCLTQLERNTFVPLGALLNGAEYKIIIECLPELDFNIIEDPVICEACRYHLGYYCKFVRNCLDIEGKLKAYCKGKENDGMCQVDILNFLQFCKDILQYPGKCSRISTINEELKMLEDAGECPYPEVYDALMKLEEELDIKEETSLEEDYCNIISEVQLCKYDDKFSSEENDKETKSNGSEMAINKHAVANDERKLSKEINSCLLINDDLEASISKHTVHKYGANDTKMCEEAAKLKDKNSELLKLKEFDATEIINLDEDSCNIPSDVRLDKYDEISLSNGKNIQICKKATRSKQRNSELLKLKVFDTTEIINLVDDSCNILSDVRLDKCDEILHSKEKNTKICEVAARLKEKNGELLKLIEFDATEVINLDEDFCNILSDVRLDKYDGIFPSNEKNMKICKEAARSKEKNSELLKVKEFDMAEIINLDEDTCNSVSDVRLDKCDETLLSKEKNMKICKESARSKEKISELLKLKEFDTTEIINLDDDSYNILSDVRPDKCDEILLSKEMSMKICKEAARLKEKNSELSKLKDFDTSEIINLDKYSCNILSDVRLDKCDEIFPSKEKESGMKSNMNSLERRYTNQKTIQANVTDDSPPIHEDIPETNRTESFEMQVSKRAVISSEIKLTKTVYSGPITNDDPEININKFTIYRSDVQNKNIPREKKPVNKHLPERFKCSLCTHESPSEYYLNKHLSVHFDMPKLVKDVRGIEIYKCSLCAYKSKQKGQLYVHKMLVHKGLKS